MATVVRVIFLTDGQAWSSYMVSRLHTGHMRTMKRCVARMSAEEFDAPGTRRMLAGVIPRQRR